MEKTLRGVKPVVGRNIRMTDGGMCIRLEGRAADVAGSRGLRLAGCGRNCVGIGLGGQVRIRALGSALCGGLLCVVGYVVENSFGSVPFLDD
jgi:hypothetical protein